MVNGKTAGKRAHQPTAYDPSMKVEMSCPTRKKWKPAESRTSRKPPPLAVWPALSGDAAAAPIHFYIVSKGRPDNVRAMHRMLAAGAREGDAPANVTWVVSTEEEVQAYREGGATHVLVGEGLCASRNRAIEDAAGAWCVQLSDDISGVSLCPDDRVVQDKTDAKEANRRIRGDARPVHVSPEYAARRVVQCMLETQTWLGGLYVNTNVARSLFQPPTSPYHFIVGDFIVVRPGSAPRFDTNMRLKEDYDFTAQHLDVYGAVCRMNRLYACAKHYVNQGGAVAYRTADREAETVAYLKHKWAQKGYPHLFRNTQRPNEVALCLKEHEKAALRRKHAAQTHHASCADPSATVSQ
jgi:hypothetical protein